MRLMIDLRTGEPSLDLEGRLKEIDTERAFRQYLDVLFQTPILTEQFVPNWGLDIRGIIESSANPIWDSIVKYLVANSLSKKNEPLVETVQSIDLTRENNELTIEVHVTSKYGTSTKNLVTVNV